MTAVKANQASTATFSSALDSKLAQFKRELALELEDAHDRLAKRMKEDKPLQKKGHEEQYHFNAKVRGKMESARRALEQVPAAVEKAKADLQEGEELVVNRQKLISRLEKKTVGRKKQWPKLSKTAAGSGSTTTPNIVHACLGRLVCRTWLLSLPLFWWCC